MTTADMLLFWKCHAAGQGCCGVSMLHHQAGSNGVHRHKHVLGARRQHNVRAASALPDGVQLRLPGRLPAAQWCKSGVTLCSSNCLGETATVVPEQSDSYVKPHGFSCMACSYRCSHMIKLKFCPSYSAFADALDCLNSCSVSSEFSSLTMMPSAPRVASPARQAAQARTWSRLWQVPAAARPVA